MAKFLLLTHIYPPAIDGGSKVIDKVGDYLKKQGNLVLVITSDRISSDDFVSTHCNQQLNHDKDNPDIIRLPLITFLHRPFKLLAKIFPSFKTFSKGPIFKFFPFIKSLKSSFKFRPDYIIAGPLPTTIIIYAHLIRLSTKLLLNYSPKLLINPCFHPHDPDFQTPLLLSLLNQSDYLWCLTNYEKKYFQKHLKITSPKYFVHGLGVDSNFIIEKKNIRYPSRPNLVFIANFSAHKRTELLIQAFKLLLTKYPQSTLTLLGQKTLYFPRITTFLKTISPSILKKIIFIFNPTQIQIKQALDLATCLILPSIHESFGLVLVESLARGKPVIGANTPQTLEVINTLGGGLTFRTDNVTSLYQTILKFIKLPNLSQKLAITGYQNVKNYYTWNKIGKQLCQKLGI